jgi:diacylglycerol kinase family enzyme
MSSPPVLLLNRACGTQGRGAVRRARAVAAVQRLDRHARVLHCAPEELTACAREQVERGAALVAVYGGDGSLGTVAGALAGTDTALGVIPGGTLNHFAHDLGVPLEPERAVAVAFGGRERRVDVGSVNEQVFVNGCSLGIYPTMVASRRAPEGPLAWWLALGRGLERAWRGFALESLWLSIDDGEERPCRTPLLFVGNNRHAFTRSHAGRRARLDEGVLSVALVRADSRRALLAQIARTWLFGPAWAPGLELFAAHTLRVRTAASGLRAALDGEVTTLEPPLRFRLRPAALRVRV